MNIKQNIVTTKTLILIILISTVPIFSQDDELDKLPYDDTPQKALKNTLAYRGVAELGYNFNFSLVNYDEINNLISNDFYNFNKLEDNLLLSGMRLSFYIPFIKNSKIGFYNLSGSALSEEKNIIQNNDTLKNVAELELNMTGISFDYGYVPFSSFAITLGVNIGFSGEMNIKLSQFSQENSWEEIENSYNNNNSIIISKRFMQLQPSFGIEWTPTNFLMLRLNTLYNLTFTDIFSDSDWKINSLGNLNNVPSGINPDAFNISLGVYIGVFNFDSLDK